MRPLEVRLRDAALSDLGEIFSYIAERSSDHVADRYIERLIAACERIGLAPEGGTARSDLRPGLRLWAFQRKAVIAYSIENDTILVARIVHRGRDLDALDWTRP